MEKGKLKVGGFPGKGWGHHVLYLGRAEGPLLLCMQWLFGIAFGRTGSRYIDTPSVVAPEAARDPLTGVHR